VPIYVDLGNCNASLLGGAGCPGKTILLSAVITNTGSCTQSFDWRLKHHSGDAVISLPVSGSTAPLPPPPPSAGDTFSIPVTINGTAGQSEVVRLETYGADDQIICSTTATVTAAKVDVTNARSSLDDQVLTGSTASLVADLDLVLGGASYQLQWSFLGQVSPWQGPYNTSPSGAYAFPVPANQDHTLSETLTVKARLFGTFDECDSFTRNMKVFFALDSANDTHNRPTGNTDANWFRHWGNDHDNACTTFSATGTVAYFGKNVTFEYGGVAGTTRAQYNNSLSDPIVTLYDFAHAPANRNFVSSAMTYLDSQGNSVNDPAGAITIVWNRSGIDQVNQSVMHEIEHLNVNLLWEDPNGQWFMAYGAHSPGVGGNDRDNDELPNAIEDTTPGYRWDVARTHANFYLSGDDEEVWIEELTSGAPAGVSGNDWAYQGKQSTPSN
jgi:hypothetical protein